MIETTNNKLRALATMALAAVLAAALLALAALAGPAQADTKRVTKRVTKTFANASAIQIPADPTVPLGTLSPASPYPSKIGVGLRDARVLDVNLTLKNISHTFLPEMDVLLVGPKGQHAFVMSDVGSFAPSDRGVSDITLVLDDEAPSPLVHGTDPLTGAYQPTEDDTWDSDFPDAFPSPAPTPSETSALSRFDSTNPRGTWKLYVVDRFFRSDINQFAGGWALTIKAKVRR